MAGPTLKNYNDNIAVLCGTKPHTCLPRDLFMMESHDHREHRNIAKRVQTDSTSTSKPDSLHSSPSTTLDLAEMTVAESVKNAVGLGETSGMITRAN